MTEMTREEILREALKSVEWVHGVCPRCSQIEPQHNLDCEIALALHDDGTVRAILDNESLPSDPLDRLAETWWLIEAIPHHRAPFVGWWNGLSPVGIAGRSWTQDANLAVRLPSRDSAIDTLEAVGLDALTARPTEHAYFAPSIAEVREAARLRTAIEVGTRHCILDLSDGNYRIEGAAWDAIVRAALVKP